MFTKDLYKNIYNIQNIPNYHKLGTAQVIFNREMGSEYKTEYDPANPTTRMSFKITVSEVLPKSTSYTIPFI